MRLLSEEESLLLLSEDRLPQMYYLYVIYEKGKDLRDVFWSDCYVGITSNLKQRVSSHCAQLRQQTSDTKLYNIISAICTTGPNKVDGLLSVDSVFLNEGSPLTFRVLAESEYASEVVAFERAARPTPSVCAPTWNTQIGGVDYRAYQYDKEGKLKKYKTVVKADYITMDFLLEKLQRWFPKK